MSKICKYAGDPTDEYCKNCDGITMEVDDKKIACTECAGYEAGENEFMDVPEDMFEEDASVIPPRIQQWRWYQICEDKEHELSAAAASWSDLTDNDIRDIHNFIIDPNYIRIINKFSGSEILNGSNC